MPHVLRALILDPDPTWRGSLRAHLARVAPEVVVEERETLSPTEFGGPDLVFVRAGEHGAQGPQAELPWGSPIRVEVESDLLTNAREARRAFRQWVACAADRQLLAQKSGDVGERYKAVVRHAAIGVALVSLDGTLLEVNRALARMLGYREVELLGRTTASLSHPDDLDPSVRAFRDLARLGRPRYEAEKRYMRKDGSVVWVHLLVNAVFSELGEPLYFVAQVADISRRKEADAASGLAARVLDAIRRVQAQFIAGGEPGLLHREVLVRFARLTGSARAFLLEQVREEGAPPRLVPLCLRGLEQLDEEEALDTTWLDDLGHDERVRGSLLSGMPLRLDVEDPPVTLPGRGRSPERFLGLPLLGEGQLRFFVGLFGAARPFDEDLLTALEPLRSNSAAVLTSQREVERRRRAERELNESQRTLQNLMDTLPGMAYRCEDDEHRTLLFCSRGALELAGYEPEELIENRRASFRSLIHPGDAERVAGAVRWAVLEGRRFELRYRIVTRHGDIRHVWEQGAAVRDDDGDVLFVEGFLSDVTAARQAEEDRLRLEARVQQGQKLESLGVLAGGIAHDFNNLLMGILGHANLALGRLEPESTEASDLRAIEEAATRAARLTDHLLAYTGRGPVRPEPADLPALLRESAPLLERGLPSRVELVLDLEEDLPKVEVDRAQLEQVLVQLVRNAAEAFGDQSGRVTISAKLQQRDARWLERTTIGPAPNTDAQVVLAVNDTGPGMEPSVKARACDPFFTTKGFGRGLGLATVLGIVRGHGGALQIESAPGFGTRVRILLPVPEEREVLIPRRAPGAGEAIEPGSTVLVVDDESVVREVAATMLREHGYEVLTADDGAAGVELYRERAREVDAVLLDLCMPRMDGETALEAMREVQPEVRVLLSSGYSEQEAMHRIAERQGVAFIQKPYRLEQLVEKLQEVLTGPGEQTAS
ncbi:MAG: PAS domain S-box protein [Planctomycetota bacterium]|jgi:PAS domain S-box-containing protein